MGGWNVSWRMMSASISARIFSRLVGRSEVCSLKGLALACSARVRAWLASLRSCGGSAWVALSAHGSAHYV